MIPVKTEVKFTVRRADRAFDESMTKTTAGRCNLERQQLEDELSELQQVEEQLIERVAAIRSKLELIRRITTGAV